MATLPSDIGTCGQVSASDGWRTGPPRTAGQPRSHSGSSAQGDRCLPKDSPFFRVAWEMLIPKENVSGIAPGDTGHLPPEQGSLRPLGGFSSPLSATYANDSHSERGLFTDPQDNAFPDLGGNLRRKSETLTPAISKRLRAWTTLRPRWPGNGAWAGHPRARPMGSQPPLSLKSRVSRVLRPPSGSPLRNI